MQIAPVCQNQPLRRRGGSAVLSTMAFNNDNGTHNKVKFFFSKKLPILKKAYCVA